MYMYMYTHIHAHLNFMFARKQAHFKTVLLFYLSETCFPSALPEKNVNFLLVVTSMMGDAQLYISSPTPRKNECKCSN